MPMKAITDDLEALFSADDFGVTEGSAVYKGVVISGIFDDEHIRVEEDDQTVFARQATFMTSTSQVPGVARGDTLTLNGNDYTIEFWEEDGTGQIDLYLSENF